VIGDLRRHGSAAVIFGDRVFAGCSVTGGTYAWP
jgi:hypothetical protein